MSLSQPHHGAQHGAHGLPLSTDHLASHEAHGAAPIKEQSVDPSERDESHHSQAQEQSEQSPPAQRTKRRRIGYACDLCRLKKNRCDGERPTCGPCRGRRQECVYSPQRTRVSVTQEYVDSLRARNRALEECLAAQRDRDLPSPSILNGQPYTLSERTTMREDWNPSGHHTSPRQAVDATPDPRSAWSAVNESNQAQRIHGRPSNASMHPPQFGARRGSQPTPKSDGRSPAEYFGESSAFDFIARVSSPTKGDESTAQTPARATAHPSGGENAPTPTRADQSMAAPGSSQTVPAAHRLSHAESLAASSPSTVVMEDLLGGSLTGAQRSGSNPFELPQRYLADRLVALYFAHRHPLCPYLHEGTFRRRYERLWRSQGEGGEEATLQNVVWLGLVNLVFAFGCDHSATQGPGASGSPLDRDRSRFFGRARTLTLSGILQGGKIELVQSLLLMGHFLHGSLELNHCWTVVGLAVRTAQALGLHLEPAQFTNDILEQEIRKRVWWGCFTLDRQISTKVGRPPIIKDDASILAELPLPVDDEYLNESCGFRQPPNLPSKLVYFRHVVGQCRLADKVLQTLYNSRTVGMGGQGLAAIRGVDMEPKSRSKTGLSDLLSLSIQLDGELVAWQQGLPPHLRPDSEAVEWHFQRQRNVLLMRFLHTRLLIHRQTLLFYISRRIRDQFQLDLIRLCISRCVSAAYESITQMRLLRQRKSLSNFWHNSHYVFAALGVLLVYQKMDPQSRPEINVSPPLDLENVIQQGLENLHRVGGEMHPLAIRYVKSFQHLQEKLNTLASLSINAPGQVTRAAPTPSNGYDQQAMPVDAERRSQDVNSDASGGVDRGKMAGSEPRNLNYGSYEDGANGGGMSGHVSPGMGFDMTDFGNEFEVLQSVLLDSGEWPSFMDFDWQQE